MWITKKWRKKIGLCFFVWAVFSGVSLCYFYPVLQGKKIMQSDIRQFIGMSKEIKDFRIKNGQEPYWTNAAFCGMPAYQLSAYYPYDFLKKIDGFLRFLPQPADYLFLYFLSFFVLLSVLKIDWKIAVFGALAFGFSTYLIVILGVGHNAKSHAIGYMPLVIAGCVCCFQKKYTIGFLGTTLAMALEIHCNHFQMTYYLLFCLLFLGVAFGEKNFKKRSFIKSILCIFWACVLGLGLNATNVLATKEYASKSTRGQSELTITPEGTEKKQQKGLSKSYITEYSYGLAETFNLLIPRFTGGANAENIGKNSHTYNFLKKYIPENQAAHFVKNAPTYWGKQPIVAAPAYIGVVFIFFMVLGIFSLKGIFKKWLIGTILFSIFLSWGKNFNILTDFFIDYVPFYNKFRAVSSIQVLAEIAIPLMGLLALQEFIHQKSKEIKKKNLLKSLGILGGLLLVFLFFGKNIFDFRGLQDAYYDQILQGFSEVLRSDRMELFKKDILRSLFLVIFSFGLLWFFMKGRLKKNIVIILLGFLMVFDLWSNSKNYVNENHFLPSRIIEKPFQKTAIDKQILKDTSHYRVANFSKNFMNEGATSYFHKSIGGYHAAKLGRYQELVDFYLSEKKHPEILNMLHVKYFILPQKTGKNKFLFNEKTNGNAWFVDSLQYANSANEEIKFLKNLDTKKIAVLNIKKFPEVLNFKKHLKKDTLAKIKLLQYKANKLVYNFQSTKSQWTIFSEMYYKKGWNAYIDGKKTKHFQANYVLRALYIPAGNHEIIFKFEPKIIAMGNKITGASYSILIGFLFFICFSNRKKIQVCIQQFLKKDTEKL